MRQAKGIPMEGVSDRYRIHVIDRAAQILDCFGFDHQELGVSEIGARTGLHRSTAHRILMALEYNDLIKQNPSTGKYHLGIKLFKLGHQAVSQLNLREICRTFLSRLMNDTKETIHLAVLDDDQVLYLDKVEGPHALRMPSRVGRHIPTYCTSLGKAMLSCLDDQEVKSILRRQTLKPHTENTAKNINQLLADLRSVRKRGYAVDNEEIEMKKADGAKVVGKKIGLTSKAMQKMLNVDQPDYGHILDNMVLQDAAVVRVGELIQPKIEPEIAFILDRELKGPGVTPMQVLAATRFVVPALEIIDSRIEGWRIKLCDTIADNASSARVVLGNSPKRLDEFDLKLLGMVLEKNGDIVQTGAGGAVLGHPAVAVAWLANSVGQYGVCLEAGEIIMPGALCAAADVKPGDLLQASFDGLGSVSVRFV